jgi:hypothetical protein
VRCSHRRVCSSIFVCQHSDSAHRVLSILRTHDTYCG